MKQIIVPELEAICVKRDDRYVEAISLTERYSLRYPEIKKVARECDSFRMMRRQSLIDYEKFDAYMASLYGWEEEWMKRREELDDPHMCAEVNKGNKRYVRYHEGAYLYSMGKRMFVRVANEADAIRKVGGVCLVSIDKLNAYIEREFS